MSAVDTLHYYMCPEFLIKQSEQGMPLLIQRKAELPMFKVHRALSMCGLRIKAKNDNGFILEAIDESDSV